MGISKVKTNLIRNLSNIPGWSTRRKIVVIESDDWGSVRMSSKQAFERLKQAGIDESNNHYNINDALECNRDLELLYEMLLKHKDMNGLHPVMTGVNIVANPHFEKIKASNYSDYYFEPVSETYSTHCVTRRNRT